MRYRIERSPVVVRVFGLDHPRPAYRAISDFAVERVKENWREYEAGKPEYDKRFVYRKCDTGVATFYSREARPGYEHLEHNHDPL